MNKHLTVDLAEQVTGILLVFWIIQLAFGANLNVTDEAENWGIQVDECASA